MKFDKSKVCVAGLNDVPVGTKGYFSDELQNLEIYVLMEHKTMLGKCAGFNCNISKYEIIASDMSWRFFYPIPEKQNRPYATIEEAMVLKGKWIKHKAWDEYIMVTRISFLNGSLLLNDLTEDVIYEKFVMEDGSPIGVEV
jgi:hypothetical protein